jgi:protein O-mannosyl-transferase
VRWNRRAQLATAAAGIVLATVLAYWGVWRLGFLRLDDPLYVTQQPIVQQGLSIAGIRWAFTTTSASNYHPVTWLSHMLDCHVTGW